MPYTDVITEALDGYRGDHQRLIAERGVGWIETLLRKNSDYGSAVFDSPILIPSSPPDEAILVRMSDKITRLRSLREKQADGSAPEINESFEDTIADLGSYCLLWLVSKSLGSSSNSVSTNQAVK